MGVKKEPVILQNKFYSSSSVFQPENLLREARRQKNLKDCQVPSICVLDPDGDLVNYLIEQGMATNNVCWACYHSKLYSFELDGTLVGIIPCIVGASYAVLVAEQLFVSGCELLISVTSAGIINEPQEAKRFALITESVRDEGTSYHYLPKEAKATIAENLLHKINGKKQNIWFTAKSWTTDAPYRETEEAIHAMENGGVTCVEMEAAALYAFGLARKKEVACFAHLTNTMARQEEDFEKGEFFGSVETLDLLKEVFRK